MADTYCDDSLGDKWWERIPFLEDAPEEEWKKEEKEGGLSPEEIERLLDSIHTNTTDEVIEELFGRDISDE